jgi:NTE family protein
VGQANQEADGVFQGGGVKGIALVGALIEFAEKGWANWVNVAGTSAGSIIACYLACGHGADDLERLLRQTPYEQFQDFGAGGKAFGGGLNLIRHHGLAHGEFFHRWFLEQTEEKTFGDVKAAGRTLKLIAADVTHKELLVLPDDLVGYRLPHGDGPIDGDSFRIADAARMSMSIPFFFQPVELVRIETGRPATIVDGGMLSNFPVWLFDVEDRDPKRPTFGFRLVDGKGVGSGLQAIVEGLGWPVRLGSDMFHTAMEAWDKRFMSHSTYVRTCPVSAGEVGATDFALTRDQQDWLLASGRKAAIEFLAHFSIDEYFNTFGRRLAPEAREVARVR